TSAIATQMGSHRVGISVTPTPELRIDGQLVELPVGGYLLLGLGERPPEKDSEWETPDPDCTPGGCYGYELFRTSEGEYRLSWPEGETLTVKPYFPNSAAFAHLSFTLVLPQQYLGRVRGLLGNYDYNPSNDLQSRSGQWVSEHDFAGLYQTFGDSWRVNAGESLFDYGPGESSESFTDRTFPSGFAVISPAQRLGAERICRDSGIQLHPRFSLEDCIFDVATMGGEAVAGYGGTPPEAEEPEEIEDDDDTDDGNYLLSKLATVGELIDWVKTGSDYVILDLICSDEPSCQVRELRLARLTASGNIVPIPVTSRDLWGRPIRGLITVDDGYILTRNVNDRFRRPIIGQVIKIDNNGEVSVIADNYAPGMRLSGQLTNLISDAGDVVLVQEVSPENDRYNTSLNIYRFGLNGELKLGEKLFDTSFDALGATINASTKLLKNTEGDYFLLAKTSRTVESDNNTVFKIDPTRGLSILVDVRLGSSSADDMFIANGDVDSNGTDLILVSNRNPLQRDGTFRKGLLRLTPQGILTSVLRLPRDFEPGRSLKNILVDGSDYLVAACNDFSGARPNDCALYRISPSGG
ncbi:MAG: VWD domain-containing protein, partial [Thermostichus sp. DRC_bins_24]